MFCFTGQHIALPSTLHEIHLVPDLVLIALDGIKGVPIKEVFYNHRFHCNCFPQIFSSQFMWLVYG